ncbi:HAMP domain-containing sensor histidine kinase [Crossiella sp. CA-258035]|uniref:sensor histidine kinase n=1 Tax=Crossiella sp. CA-258035 TaxID=2981138 RepID=UPI0024BC4CC0|nr:HAMP domain-containing sensor histidine kinase [Crossiella sp. CA-258035]WHT22117.1 HAMP domain-containing sensor histidine kinase [Crossiella sp. CA-258035]
MRGRLLAALLAFAVLAVAAFAWPLLMSTAAERTQQLLLSRTADLDRFAALADTANATADLGTLTAEVRRYGELYGEAVLVVDTRRQSLVATGDLRPADPAVVRLVDGALRNERASTVDSLTPWSAEPVLLARPVGTGIRVTGAVVLRASVTAAAGDIARRWVVVLLGALAAAIACAALALGVSRWVLRPLRELERGVRAVASGEPHAQVAVHGPSELRTVAAAFNQMSDAVSDAAERQRRLVAEASHQLRNPMTALRLRVDALGPSVAEPAQRSYQSVLGEVDRLESLLDGLLTLASAENRAAELRAPAAPEEPAADCEPLLVLADRRDAWSAAAEAAGITLRVGAAPATPVLAAFPAEELAQVLDVVLDNAIKYAGSGATVTLRLLTEPELLRLTVTDTGPGLSAAELALATERFWRSQGHRGSRGSGLGLAIAEQLLTAHGGELSLHRAEPHGLSVHIGLPRAAG